MQIIKDYQLYQRLPVKLAKCLVIFAFLPFKFALSWHFSVFPFKFALSWDFSVFPVKFALSWDFSVFPFIFAFFLLNLHCCGILAFFPRQCKFKRKNANIKGKTLKSHDNANLTGKTLKSHYNTNLKGKTLKCHDNANLKGKTQI